ncbi:MAG: hypothetical protein ACLFSR_03850 [Halomonas sp.]
MNETVRGRLSLLHRRPRSRMGNTRWVVAIDTPAGERVVLYTRPDCMLAYGLPAFKGREVEVTFSPLRGVPCITDIRNAGGAK